MWSDAIVVKVQAGERRALQKHRRQHTRTLASDADKHLYA